MYKTMDWLRHIGTQVEPVQLVYGSIAVIGGVARYLNNYTQGQNFSFKLFIASGFVSGFSGWMFATMGISLDMPQAVVFMMAGTGGFFGDQTLKLIYEYTQTKIPGRKL